jgi:hypothetical protein
VVGLGVRFDLAAGASAGLLAATVVPAVVLAFLLAGAARAAAARPSTATAYGATWLALGVILPVVRAVLAWDGAPAGDPWTGLRVAAAATPLGWLYDRLATATVAWQAAVPPCAVALVLWSAFHAAGRRES